MMWILRGGGGQPFASTDDIVRFDVDGGRVIKVVLSFDCRKVCSGDIDKVEHIPAKANAK